jgi:hypothetical protein
VPGPASPATVWPLLPDEELDEGVPDDDPLDAPPLDAPPPDASAPCVSSELGSPPVPVPESSVPAIAAQPARPIAATTTARESKPILVQDTRIRADRHLDGAAAHT